MFRRILGVPLGLDHLRSPFDPVESKYSNSPSH